MNISDSNYITEEREMRQLFTQVGWNHSAALTNQKRIDRITEKAQFQNITKESASFIFLSFGSVLPHFLAASFGQIPPSPQNSYRA